MIKKKLRAFDVDGMVVTDELVLLSVYAGKVGAGQSIVEVGSYLGRSAIALAEGSREDVTVYAVDPYDDYQVMTPDGRGFNYTTINRNIFINNVERVGFGDRVAHVHKTATEAGQAWDGGEVGLLFIDARHDFDNVKADFDAWAGHVAVGGYVAFHDYGAERGVTDFVDGVIDAGDYVTVDYLRTTIVLQKMVETSSPKKRKTKP